MKQATIRSVCECQSDLEAIVDEHHYVLAGFIIGANEGVRERAPAHTIEVSGSRFDVAWLCNFCGRNTLRSFDGDGLSFRDGELPPPAAGPAPQLLGVPGPGPSTPGLRWAPASPASSRMAAASAAPISARPSTTSSNTATAVALKSMNVTQKAQIPGARPSSAPPPIVPPSRPFPVAAPAAAAPPSRPSSSTPATLPTGATPVEPPPASVPNPEKK
jgi:hypothetical protein